MITKEQYTFKPSEYQAPILQHMEENLDTIKPYIDTKGKWIIAPEDLVLPNVLVQASAGSGKTTLIAECFRLAYVRNIPLEMITVVSFVRKNVDDIKAKLKVMVDPELREDAAKCVKTFNGLGYTLYMNALNKWNELHPERHCSIYDVHQEKKYNWIIERQFAAQGWNEAICSKAAMHQLVDKLREQVELLVPNSEKPDANLELLQKLCKRFGIYCNAYDKQQWSMVTEMARSVLYEGIKLANPYFTSEPTADFNDQCFIPIIMALSMNQNTAIYDHFKIALEEWKQSHALIMADEVQDINPVLLKMLKYLSHDSNITMIVGDPGQNIYRWRGSESKGMENLGIDINAIDYSLPISYRLPKGHVDMIKAIWPERPIKHYHQDKGHVEIIVQEDSNWMDKLERIITLPEQKLFVARKNANAFKLAVQLLGKGYLIKTKKLATQAKTYAQQVLGKYGKGQKITWPDDPYQVLDMIEQWRDRTIRYRRDQGDGEDALQEVVDWSEALTVTFLGIPSTDPNEQNKIPQCWEDWEENIGRLNTRKRAAKYNIITINTIHAAKGAEAPIVVLIDPDDCPLKWDNQADEDYEQEMNALFVALSRAKITDEPNSGTLVLLAKNYALPNLWRNVVHQFVSSGKVLKLPFANEPDSILKMAG